MKCYNITGEFIHPDFIKDGLFKKYVIFLSGNISTYIYTSLNMEELINILTAKDFNIIYNQYGLKKIISKNHIVTIQEEKIYGN